ncbi:homoserine O-acetyltransferase/O-succinyltransferase family protein [Liquorilactobacillus vini]|uniref:homoserine O-acetyltransferase/O-succinyltransferase family protein n=1 Tax=Liquorilactobacillus vini TaxID=238015 RepID=UPI0002FEB2C3|nr:homoserine O-succinyltransferase [Liquorilactobacillus vini]
MSAKSLQIGILNLMHDKAATQADFRQVLQNGLYPVELHFYYPIMHYLDRPVPTEVLKSAKPLDLKEVASLDAFIITGAPLDQLDFEQVTYLPELQELFRALKQVPQRLYLCWGAMVALYDQYHIAKEVLPKKLFGVFPQKIIQSSPLLTGLPNGFWAPHARYADSNRHQIETDSQLTVKAVNQDGRLLLVQNQAGNETMLFSHLEYQAGSLVAEYQREIMAHPKKHYRLPINQAGREFAWKHTQKVFFTNWLQQVVATIKNGGLIYG